MKFSTISEAMAAYTEAVEYLKNEGAEFDVIHPCDVLLIKYSGDPDFEEFHSALTTLAKSNLFENVVVTPMNLEFTGMDYLQYKKHLEKELEVLTDKIKITH